ncbi:hypothetical protein EXN66_Car006004 [Channa argus]|uniref:Uncharacterized protein n=1 Tax=Channa argus TaxID=215402 RepID=A0A6G1PJA6_CHAAH|nr:hypothetical protein EXN66_Car006004 [Channa argus]
MMVISRLSYFNALFMRSPVSTIKPLFRSLHWLPVAARIRFKALSLAHRVITSTAPAYLNSPHSGLQSLPSAEVCQRTMSGGPSVAQKTPSKTLQLKYPIKVERAAKLCSLSSLTHNIKKTAENKTPLHLPMNLNLFLALASHEM